MAASRSPFFFLFVLFDITFIILYRTIASFDEDTTQPSYYDTPVGDKTKPLHFHETLDYDPLHYLFYTHLIAMTLIGYGYFNSFGRRGNLVAVVYNFAYAAVALQWALLVNEFWYRVFTSHWSNNFNINIHDLIRATYTTISVLITASAVLGKISYIQLVLVGGVEIIMYGLNVYILRDNLNIADYELHLYVHEFGAFFGLGFVLLYNKNFGEAAADAKKPSHSGNLTAFLGTAVLFAFYPSFNAALAPQEFQTRVIINTFLSLASAAATSVVFSSFFNNGRLLTEEIRNGTIAGGIAMSSSIAVVNGPAAALGTGLVAAMTVVLGLRFLDGAAFAKKYADPARALSTNILASLVAGVGVMITLADAHSQGTFYGADFHYYYSSGKNAAGNEVAAYFITMGIALFSGIAVAGFFSLPAFHPRSEADSLDGADYLVAEDVATDAVPAAAAAATRDFELEYVAPAAPAAPVAPVTYAAPVYTQPPAAAPVYTQPPVAEPVFVPTPAPVAAVAAPAYPSIRRADFENFTSEQVAGWLEQIGINNQGQRVIADGIIGADILESPEDRLSTYFGPFEASRVTAALRALY